MTVRSFARACAILARALCSTPVSFPSFFRSFVRVFGKQLRAVEVSIVHGSC